VDKNPASLWDGNTAGAIAVTSIVGCATDGGTGCGGIFAQSRATPGTALKDATTITWARAARACANAGKRLLTPGEWIMARSFGSGVLNGMFTDGNSEWVDAVVATSPTEDNTGFDGTGLFGVGHMGPAIGGSGGSQASGVVGFVASNVYTDTAASTIGFRCAR